ncbi:MAG: hypothetical protein IKJ04_04235 [Clostridia bacterium]|nr:hypothetical protein [Clostridia bacterium]
MKISLRFVDQFGDVDLKYQDADGEHSLPVAMDTENNLREIDILGDSLEITVKPTKLDLGINKEEVSGTAEKVFLKFTEKFASVANNMLLHVGCRYIVNDLQDGDVIDVTCRNYSVSGSDQMFIFDLYPVVYFFFELSKNDRRYDPLDIIPINRDKVLKSARVLALADFGLHLIVTYPFQVGRVKRLTKEKTVKKKLKAFNVMSEEKRKKILERS